MKQCYNEHIEIAHPVCKFHKLFIRKTLVCLIRARRYSYQYNDTYELKRKLDDYVIIVILLYHFIN